MRIRLLVAVTSLSLTALPGTLNAQAAPKPSMGGETEAAPRSAAEANARAIPGPPTTRIERSDDPNLPDRVVTTYPGNLAPPPASAFDKRYPVCTATVQDSCQNPGEGGAPGRSRALDAGRGSPPAIETERLRKPEGRSAS